MLSTLMLAATAAQAAPPTFPAATQQAIFHAAETTRIPGGWTLCAEDPRREAATIEAPGDVNGDGRPEALVIQSSLFCYGSGGAGFALVSQQPDGSWRLVPGAAGQGVPIFLPARSRSGWQDLELGGPGFCSPVWRHDGREYALHRRCPS